MTGPVEETKGGPRRMENEMSKQTGAGNGRMLWDRVRLLEWNRRLVRGALVVLAALLFGASQPAHAAQPAGLEAGLDSILLPVVADGRVDYAYLKEHPGPLDEWLLSTESLSLSEVASWPRESRLAFYLNVYNARIVAIVRDHYPIAGIAGSDSLYPAGSIQQIPGVWSLPFRLAGQNTSLTGLERDILWPEAGDPSVHFGLVRASLGGPRFAGAFHGERYVEELWARRAEFLEDPAKVRIEPGEGPVRISSLFDTQRQDFLRIRLVAPNLRKEFRDLAGSLTFIASVLMGPKGDYLLKGGYAVEFLPYDWTLNERPQTGRPQTGR